LFNDPLAQLSPDLITDGESDLDERINSESDSDGVSNEYDLQGEIIELDDMCEEGVEKDERDEEGWEDIDSDRTDYTPSLSSRSVFTGNYSPYFLSYTTAALSLFLANSRVNRSKFNSLLRILRHSEFQVSDLPSSYNQCKKFLQGLPMLPIHIRDKESSYVNKTPWYRLITIQSRMYLGAGMKVEEPKEFFHGTIWRESPLFGADHVTNTIGEILLNLAVSRLVVVIYLVN